MQVTPSVAHVNGIITVTMSAAFIGDPTDSSDRQRITAYGDPRINLAGAYTDPNDPSFSFTFPTQQVFVGVTTGMQNYPVRFMASLPQAPRPGGGYHTFSPQAAAYQNDPSTEWNATFPASTPTTLQRPLDCVVSDPVRAATIWASAIDDVVQSAMNTLRLKQPVMLTSLPGATI